MGLISSIHFGLSTGRCGGVCVKNVCFCAGLCLGVVDGCALVEFLVGSGVFC